MPAALLMSERFLAHRQPIEYKKEIIKPKIGSGNNVPMTR